LTGIAGWAKGEDLGQPYRSYLSGVRSTSASSGAAVAAAPTVSAASVVARVGSRGGVVVVVQRVVGTTADGVYGPNTACLASQTRWAKARHVYTGVYAVATYPTASQFAAYRYRGPYKATTFSGRMNNVGFAQARFNVASMRRVGLSSPFVWIDVEPARPGWSTSKAADKAAIDGARYGYTSAGYKVGFYSAASMWSTILGATRYGLPEWRTAGPRSQAVANARCARSYSFQGGGAVLSQWWVPFIYYDTTCPSANTPGLLATYFHRY
jgi:hypothetical protein